LRRDAGGARFATGARDIRDDLRERLRRNGVRGDWDRQDARPGTRVRRGGANDWDAPQRRRGGSGWDEPGRLRRGPRGGGGSRGEPDGGQRRKGSWWRHWTLKKALTVAAALIGLLIVLAAVGAAYAYSKTPIPDPQQSVFAQASKVYFRDGKAQVGQFGTTNRVILTYNQIPPLVRDAVVAAEDKNFWHEGGISPTGILRAAYYDLTSSGGNLQGGSTITQQLVRNYYENIGTAQTLSRKIKEIFVAQKLAQVKSKAWILTQYLNTIYFGRGAYGIGAAAQAYFGKPATRLARLTPAQAAMLAAMIQSPGYYSPDPKAGAAYQGLVYRWKYVLSTMVSMGTLASPAEAQALRKFPTVGPPVSDTWGGYRGYIMQAVQYELENTYHYAPGQINAAGLRIVTTFSQRLMNSLYAAVRWNEKMMRHCAPPALLSGAAPAPCTGLPRYVRAGAVLEQVGTGAILAMYSGQNYDKTQYDNALQSRNQVGSSFKPYVLATAVQQGMNVQTSVLNGDSPLWIPPDSQPAAYARTGGPQPGPGWYEISNDESGNNNFGPVSVQTATAASLNTAYADLWHQVALNPQTGAHNVVNMARAFGVDIQASGLVGMEDQAGTALGQASLTVEEQATTIAALANNGQYVTPHVIAKITRGNSVVQAKVTRRQVLTPAQAADADWAMSADTSAGGTAAGLGLTNGQTVIAKTGTTNLAQSAFFMGATPRYAMAVGMFVNKPKCPKRLSSLCQSPAALAFAPPKGLQTLFGVGGMSGYGGQWPALIWHTYFMKNFNGLPLEPFAPVNSDGARWNLFGALPEPKPRQGQNSGPGPGHGCHGQGRCHHNPVPTPPPNPTPTGRPSPTPSPTGHPGG
jgi:membrane peptidoglycan carboxypeptidase